MPDFRLPTTRGSKGPKPQCYCGICAKCKSRDRQRRWYERQQALGYSSETDTIVDLEVDERICLIHDCPYSLKVGCPQCRGVDGI